MLVSTILLYIFGTFFSYAESAKTAFDFQVTNNGSYSLTINGTRWLESGPVFFNAMDEVWSSDDDDYPLTLTGVRNVTGGGLVDGWFETQFTYKLGNTTAVVMVAIRRYNAAYPSKILFTQKFTSGAANSSRSDSSQNETISGFPCFQVKDGDEPLGFLSYGGFMFGYTDMKMSTFDSSTDNINDGMTGGPLAIFNKAGKAVVISPYNNFMASSAWHINKPGGHVCWGIMGGVNEVPANFSYSTLLVYDDGINQAFETWGAQLRNQFGIMQEIKREELKRKDITLNYLGYWTDNGAYYYYNPEHNKTYDDTLVDVKHFAGNYLLPYKYIQLDSWWYAKDKDYSAVLTWTPTQTAFPDGIQNFTDRTDWPAAMHNRYWSKDTPYAKANGGNYTFVMGNVTSLPNDQEFWRFLMSRAKNWGMIVYEQDWLNVQTEYLPQLQTSLTLGRDWLKQMATAAVENNITIQYCMANPRHALQSLEFPVVTQARVSDDYLYETMEHRQPQWKVGVSSIFAKAMRVQPYKDTFWTTTNQPGNPRYKDLTEPYPKLESAVASLTARPVGTGDMINGTDFGLIPKCCRRDGLLLKPSEPATAIDKQIIMDAFRPKGSPKIGDIWTTVSAINTNGLQTEYGILFAADIQGSLTVGMEDLKFTELKIGVYFPYNNNSAWGYFNSSTRIDLTGCSKKNFCLYYFSPFLKGKGAVEAILGETVKWIPMSAQRVSYIHVADDGTLDVNFTRVTEEVMPQIVYILHGKLWSRDCLMEPGVIPVCRLWEPSAIKPHNSAVVHRSISYNSSLVYVFIVFSWYTKVWF